MGDLFDRLCAPETLEAAARRTFRGKRRRPDVAWFCLTWDAGLARIRARLRSGAWCPRPLEIIPIRDPKPRAIAVPAVEDRVVHRAVADLLAEQYARKLMPEDFACRPGRGQHRALLSIRRAMQRHAFAVHLDVKRYFPSIRVATLKALLRPVVGDAELLTVIDALVDQGPEIYRYEVVRHYARLAPDWPPAGCGLAVGTATSQFLAAHVYLLAFDHFVKRTLKVPVAARYVDDVFCFGDHRRDLRAWREAIAGWLEAERGLRLKSPEARVLSCRGHVDALGYRVRRDGFEPLPRTFTRLTARVRAAWATEGEADLRRSFAATAGNVRF